MKRNKVYPVVVKEWTESERGWGTRPDGYSVHLTNADSEKFLAEYDEREKKRNPSSGVPECYSFPEVGSIVKDVGEEVYQKLLDCRKSNSYGYWISSLRELNTPKENKEQEKAEQLAAAAKAKAIQDRETLRENALNKLTNEEKEVLGLNKNPKTSKNPNFQWH